MQKSARQQLLNDYRVPESLLRRFTGEVETRICAKLEDRMAALESQFVQLADREHFWRQKYFKAEEKRQKVELLMSLKDKQIAELLDKVEKQYSSMEVA